jgi:hypothetical protein
MHFSFYFIFKKTEIIKALENKKIEDVKKWTQENIGKTILQSRKAILSKG